MKDFGHSKAEAIFGAQIVLFAFYSFFIIIIASSCLFGLPEWPKSGYDIVFVAVTAAVLPVVLAIIWYYSNTFGPQVIVRVDDEQVIIIIDGVEFERRKVLNYVSSNFSWARSGSRLVFDGEADLVLPNMSLFKKMQIRKYIEDNKQKVSGIDCG